MNFFYDREDANLAGALSMALSLLTIALWVLAAVSWKGGAYNTALALAGTGVSTYLIGGWAVMLMLRLGEQDHG